MNMRAKRTNAAQGYTPSTGLPSLKRHRPVVWVLLALLLFIACAVLGYLLFVTMDTTSKQSADLKILSSKIDALNVKNAELEKAATVKSEIATTKTDEQQITETLNAQARAQVGNDGVLPKLTIDTLEPPFAGVSVAYESGGEFCVLKKSDSIWLILYCAQGEGEQTDKLNRVYGVPERISTL